MSSGKLLRRGRRSRWAKSPHWTDQRRQGTFWSRIRTLCWASLARGCKLRSKGIGMLIRSWTIRCRWSKKYTCLKSRRMMRRMQRNTTLIQLISLLALSCSRLRLLTYQSTLPKKWKRFRSSVIKAKCNLERLRSLSQCKVATVSIHFIQLAIYVRHHK